MFKRNIYDDLIKGISRSPAILLTGARQTGKTTLMKQIAKEYNYSYITFDDIRFLSAARNNPIDFILGLEKPVILDEVQRVPEIFLPIKQDIDENRIPGRYLLTGSANPLLIPRVGDSLVGRLEIFNLFPLSQGEIIGKKEKFIDNIFNVEHKFKKIKDLNRNDIFEKIIIGGYPLVQDSSEKNRFAWFESYINLLLQRDIQDLASISGITEFPKLLNILATRAGNLLNVSELSRTAGIPSTTLHRYLNLLEALFLISFQSAWSSNLGKRYVKSPKINLIDSGILSFLLNINSKNLLMDNKLIGNIFENFVLSELIKQASWSDLKIKIYHFRTNTGIEVDIILENLDGNIVAIEVKSSQTVTPSDFKGLKYLHEEIKNKFLRGIIIYTGTEIIPFEKNMIALPISYLWN